MLPLKTNIFLPNLASDLFLPAKPYFNQWVINTFCNQFHPQTHVDCIKHIPVMGRRPGGSTRILFLGAYVLPCFHKLCFWNICWKIWVYQANFYKNVCLESWNLKWKVTVMKIWPAKGVHESGTCLYYFPKRLFPSPHRVIVLYKC